MIISYRAAGGLALWGLTDSKFIKLLSRYGCFVIILGSIPLSGSSPAVEACIIIEFTQLKYIRKSSNTEN